jgi:HSP20 family protein
MATRSRARRGQQVPDSIGDLALMPLLALQSVVNQEFDQFIARHGVSRSEVGAPSKAFNPNVNVLVQNGHVLVEVELPGVKEEDLEASVVDSVLTIRGIRRPEPDGADAQSTRREFRYGAFERSLALPLPVETEHVEGTISDGILRIVLPVSPRRPEPPKRIPLHGNALGLAGERVGATSAGK